MVHLSIPRDWGVLDFFVLPYFRERTYAGTKGRLRSAQKINIEDVRYESSDQRHHLDFAIRYSQTIGDWDFGVYHFNGTAREPLLLLDSNAERIPFYIQINQTGLDIQRVLGQWLYKLEALYRSGEGRDYFASVGGFEYTLVGVADTAVDLGLITELSYDDRGDSSPVSYQNDLMLGLRVSLNDAASSELLLGLTQDLKNSSRAISIEASRRIGSNWKATLEGWAFFNLKENDPSYGLRDDDYIQAELAYYF